MDIGTIIAGLQAIASVAEAMNKAPALTPAQAEGEKPKKQAVQQPMVVVLPNQTPPMGIMPPPPPPMPSYPSYWSQPPSANVLRNPFWRDIRHNAIDMPVFRGVPPTTSFPEFRPEPSFAELYQLYFGTWF